MIIIIDYIIYVIIYHGMEDINDDSNLLELTFRFSGCSSIVLSSEDVNLHELWLANKLKGQSTNLVQV